MYSNLSFVFSEKQAEGSSLTADHITELISCLRDNIRSPDRKQLTSSLLELRAKLITAAVSPNSLQVVLFSFQDAVSYFRVNTDYTAVNYMFGEIFEWNITLLTIVLNCLLCM